MWTFIDLLYSSEDVCSCMLYYTDVICVLIVCLCEIQEAGDAVCGVV